MSEGGGGGSVPLGAGGSVEGGGGGRREGGREGGMEGVREGERREVGRDQGGGEREEGEGEGGREGGREGGDGEGGDEEEVYVAERAKLLNYVGPTSSRQPQWCNLYSRIRISKMLEVS